jgi:hypothetical protein
MIIVPRGVAAMANGLGAPLDIFESRKTHEAGKGPSRFSHRGTAEKVLDHEQRGWAVILARKVDKLDDRAECSEVVDCGERFAVQEAEKQSQDLLCLYFFVGELDLA